jgi:hypothetical protein
VLSSVNLTGNRATPQQALRLVEMAGSKENLRSLCGFKRDATSLFLVPLDRLTAGCAVLLSNELQSSVRVAVLGMCRPLDDVPTVNVFSSATHVDFREFDLGPVGAKIFSAFLPKCRWAA